MKVLVTATSKHGSTREIADGIAEELRAAGLNVDMCDASSVTSLDSYDAVVIGSAIYMGGWMPEAKRMVERLGPRLRSLPVWLFSSGPLGSDAPQPAGDPAQVPGLIEQTNARGHRVFTGRLDRDSLGFFERMIARMAHAPDGDFRDWDAIRDWVRAIATEMNATTPIPASAG